MRCLILVGLLPTLLLAQEFEFRQEFDTIPVEIDGWYPWAPWTGGELETAPEFCDIDADGDYDCFVGNWGYRITYYENIGTSQNPQFSFITKWFGEVTLDSIYSGRLDPSFVDIDADGDFDLFSGSPTGIVHYWENIGTPQSCQFILVTDTLENIDIPGYAHTAFTDIDNDNDLDIFLGDNLGHIHYYQNIGSVEVFDFELVTSQFENIDVGWKASPCFVDIDGDEDEDLFIGNEAGKIWYYRNDSDSISINFTYITDFYNEIDVGDYASPDFIDINGDNDFDLFMGRYVITSDSSSPGDIFFYENTGQPQAPSWNLVTQNYLTLELASFVGNHGTDIDADLDHDMFINSRLWESISYYENIGTSISPSFIWITDSYQDISVNDATIFFSDIDDDQDPDLFIGEARIPNPPYPGLYLFQNVGSPQNAVFLEVSNNLVPGNYDAAIRPALADIDADGDEDLFLSDNDAILYFFENIGSPTSPYFEDPVLNWQDIHTETGTPMCFYDIDQDDDLDLFVIPHSWYDILWFYRNTGTPELPNMELETQAFLGTNVDLSFPSGIDIVDIDADGDGDFLIASCNGGISFFRNVTGEPAVPPLRRHPQAGLHLSLGPNPANPVTWVTFHLPAPQKATLAVYNLLGQRVAILAQGLQPPGIHTYFWNASGFASGVYVIRLETPEYLSAQQIVVLK